MPLYDLWCSKCEKVQQDVWLKTDDCVPDCDVCKGEQTKICNCHSFKLISDVKTQSCGWGHDGYAHNAYWDEVKKQRAEGKDVRGADEPA